MIGGKVRSSKRMSSRRKSPKRKSSKRKSPKTSAWIRKLQAWRKAHRHVDGSLPSMKSAMKHCKGRSARKQKCRKNQGRKPSPKRKSSKRKSTKRKSSKRKSTKRKSSKKKSKKKSTKKRSYTRKPKALPALVSAQRDQLSELRFYGPRFQQAALLRKQKEEAMAPFFEPAKKYQPQQQLGPLFGQDLPQGLQNFQQQQDSMLGTQTRQQAQARQVRQMFAQLPGSQLIQQKQQNPASSQARQVRQMFAQLPGSQLIQQNPASAQAAPAAQEAQSGILSMLGL